MYCKTFKILFVYLSSSKQQQVDSFIPVFLIVKAMRHDHGLQGLMASFQGTLRLWMIGRSHYMFNAQLMHYLLENPRYEIGTLVRLNFFGHATLCEEFAQSLDNPLG